MTVEDESFNMFEILRNFATRSQEQGFVNVIVSEYLLKDYMADNDKILPLTPRPSPISWRTMPARCGTFPSG